MGWSQFYPLDLFLFISSGGGLYGLIVLAATAVVVHWAFRYQQWCNALNRLPGPPAAWPLIGHARYLIRPGLSISECLLRALKSGEIANVIAREHGYFHLAFGPSHSVVITRPEPAKKIFVASTAHNPKAKEYTYLHPWLGTGLITSSGAKWRSRRRLLTPAFHFDILRDFLPIMTEQVERFVRLLPLFPTSKKASAEGLIIIDIVPQITALTLDIISETAMGVKVNAQEDPNSAYYQAILAMSRVPVERSYSPLHMIDGIYHYLTPMGWRERSLLRTIHKFEDEVILRRKEQLINDMQKSQSPKVTTNNNTTNNDDVRNPKRRLAFLDILLKEHLRDPDHFTLKDVQEETETFMFAGHDTTAMSLVWTLLALGAHEEIQQRVIDEVDLVLGPVERSDEPIRPARLNDLTYLEAVIKESLRLHPSVPFIGRTATEDIHLGSGHVIPRGTSTYVSLINIHLDDRLYPDPHKFDPSRFLANEKRHPYAYVPFSAGLRNCIGQRFALMEEKIIIASILRRFRLRSITREADVRAGIEIVFRPLDPMVIEFIPRDQS